ncbi:MAG: hypothetical protein AAFN74_24885 [Myxococcota bacterium]
MRARKANRTSNSVDAARTKIENRKKAADENLQAAKDKANGSIIGGAIGILLLAVAIAAAVALGPVGIGLAAGALAIGGGLLAASPAIGGATGKVSLLDFDGNLRSTVVAGLSRSTMSVGPFEPDLET